MKFNSDHIDTLIWKRLCGQETAGEREELNNWIDQDPGNRKLFEKSRQAWICSRPPFLRQDMEEDLEKIRLQIIQKLSSLQQRKNRVLWLYRAAAILAVPLLLVGSWYFGNHSSAYPRQNLCEVSAPKGQRSECTLPDGTHVWLNSGTTIQYEPDFFKEERTVNLKGEAYFDVAKKSGNSFLVNTSEVQVKVLGTSFNLRAYPDEEKTETTLEKGLITLTLKAFPQQEPIKLNPGEHAAYHTGSRKINIEKTEIYLHTAWRDGKYIFKNANLATIIKQLEKQYDVRIHLKNDSIGMLRFRGMFEYSQNIFDALETIERTNSLQYRIDGRDIWLE